MNFQEIPFQHILARHSKQFVDSYPESGPLTDADQKLFEVYGLTANMDPIELREVGDHASNIRHESWGVHTDAAPATAPYQNFRQDLLLIVANNHHFWLFNQKWNVPFAISEKL